MCIALGVLDRLSIQIGELNENIQINISDLYKQQSELDLEIQDILHFIEFHKNMDACSGYKYAKQIQEIRNKRRELKNEREALESISFSSTVRPRLGEMRDKIHKLKDAQVKRKYTPRVLKNNYNIAQLNKVNKTGIKIKPDNHLDRMTYLINQVASN